MEKGDEEKGDEEKGVSGLVKML